MHSDSRPLLPSCLSCLQVFDTHNPATADVISSIAHGSAADVDLAVAAARKAFETGPWRRMTPSERGKIVWRVGELITKHADELVRSALDPTPSACVLLRLWALTRAVSTNSLAWLA